MLQHLLFEYDLWFSIVFQCLKMFKRAGERKRLLKTLLRWRKLTGVRMEACTLVLLMKSLLPNYVKKHNMFGMRSVQLLTGTKEPSTAKERQSKHAERKKASVVGGKNSQRVGGRISYQAILLREKNKIKYCYNTHVLMGPLLQNIAIYSRRGRSVRAIHSAHAINSSTSNYLLLLNDSLKLLQEGR